MDATRSDVKFLTAVIEAAIRAGATTINIPDTVGYAIPSEFGELIRTLRQTVKGIEKVTLSVHCHNDLGLAVANSLAADPEWRQTGGVHDQRDRREGRQHLPRRGGYGHPHAQGSASILYANPSQTYLRHQSPGLQDHRHGRSAQQGDRGCQCLCP